MKRRQFIKSAFLGALTGALELKAGNLFAKSGETNVEDNDLVAVMGGEPAQMYKRAIEAMGGIKRYVKTGNKVVVKPNIGWDKRPEFGANTNPELVSAIIKDCLAAGASEVVVFDYTCDEWRSCYKNSGIEDAVKAAGGNIAFAHDEKYYKSVSLPKGTRLKEVKIHEAIINCDVWINVPILKTHGGTRMTISMKNYMGIIWDRIFWHANDLNQCIADCVTYGKKPVLNIIDAYRVMTQNGPRGKSVEDVRIAKALFISTDIVAADTAAVRFFNQFKEMRVEEVGHILIAERLGEGTTNLDNLRVKRIKIG